MNIEYIKLTDIHASSKNPRKITAGNLRKLVRSILVFYKMLELRPLIINGRNIIIGGNMRFKALNDIYARTYKDIVAMLEGTEDYQKLEEKQKTGICRHWEAWKEEPLVPVINAKALTAEERRQFVIKDNASYGEWDFEELQQSWADVSFKDWGVGFDFSGFETKNALPADGGESKKTDATLQQQVIEEVKRKAWKRAGVNERCSDLKERIMLYKRKERYYTTIYSATELGVPFSKIKTADFVELCAASAVKMIRGLGFTQSKNLCILTAPQRRSQGWNFAEEVCKVIAATLNIPFYEGWVEAVNRERINPKFHKKRDVVEDNVIFYDDIITTGSTVDACLNLLPNKNVLCLFSIKNRDT